MKRKIFQSMILLSLLAVLLSFSLEFAVLYSEFSLEMRSEVKNEAEYVLAGFEMDGEVYLQNLENRPNKSRITLISKDGSVLYDSKAEESGLQNHLDRPEIISAFQVGRGEAERYSSTLGEKTYYYAIALSDNLVLRLSMTVFFQKSFPHCRSLHSSRLPYFASLCSLPEH